MAHEQKHFIDVCHCSDAELVSRLKDLVTTDRAVNAKLLVHLGEVDARRLYREQGYSSMFEYAVSALSMSESEAYLRIQAARLGRRFPVILERISAGHLNLTAIKLLAPHLTEANHVVLLDRVRGKRKRDIERLVAELAPKPDVPERMRKLPTPTISPSAPLPPPQATRAASVVVPEQTSTRNTPPPATPSPAPEPARSQPVPSPSFALQPPRPRATATPLRPARYKLELTIEQEVHDQLQQLRELLRHGNPGGDLAPIIKQAVGEFFERTLRRRFAKKQAKTASKPKVQRRAAGRKRAVARSRYVPRAVVREVFERDQCQCTFVSPSGQRCGARGFLELHHHTPFARAGAATADNLRVTCRVHNALYAERDYGRSFMQAKLREATSLRRAASDSVQNDSKCDQPASGLILEMRDRSA
jgi:5-methylcytosine-specific restriction endonuclease McrA